MKIDTLPAKSLTPDHVSAWSALQRRDPAVHHPMLGPEYTLAAAEVIEGVEVAVFEQEGRYVGFFPFQRDGRNVGRPVAWRMTDMQGIVVDGRIDWSVEQLMRETRLATWHFDHLVASQEPFRPYHRRTEDSAYIDLSDGYEAYRASRRAASSLVGTVERKARKLHREVGPLRFQMHTSDAHVLESLAAWKQIHLQNKGHYDVFQCDWMRGLMQRVVAARGEAFAGTLSALYAGEELLAVHLGLQSYDFLASWIPTFNPDYARYSPGVILYLELARQAADSGVRRIELGRGYNPMISALASGADPVAIGSVDRFGLNRALNAAWYRTRDFVYATPLSGTPLKVFRRVRNLLTTR